MRRTYYRVTADHPAPEFQLHNHRIAVTEIGGAVSISGRRLGCSRDYRAPADRAIRIFLAEHGMRLTDLIPD